MIDEVRALLTRHLPGYEVPSVTKLGEGLDNAAYEVNGELIVRQARRPTPTAEASRPGARRTCWPR